MDEVELPPLFSPSSKCPVKILINRFVLLVIVLFSGLSYGSAEGQPGPQRVNESVPVSEKENFYGSQIEFTFSPSDLLADGRQVIVGEEISFNLTILIPPSLIARDENGERDEWILSLSAKSVTPAGKEIIQIYGSDPASEPWESIQHFKLNELINHAGQSHEFNNQSVQLDLNFRVRGTFLGHAKVLVQLHRQTQSNATSESRLVTESLKIKDYLVDVIRDQGRLDVAFRVVIILLVWLCYINMGSSLDLKIVRESIRRPLGPIIGLVSQFTVMPIASYFVGSWLFPNEPSLRLGLFVLGCSPGGSSSNFWTLLFDGDTDLSITMTFISTVAALGMMPLWLFTFGRSLIADEGRIIVIPFRNLFFSLTTLSIPLLIGFLIAYYRPKFAEVSQRIVKPLTILVLLTIILMTSFMYTHIYAMFTWRIMAAASIVTLCGYTFGGGIAWLARLPPRQIIAVSIETAFQNGGIAFVLLLLSLHEPDADIAGVPAIAQVVICSQPLFLIFIVTKIYDYFKHRKLTPIPY